MYFDEGPKRSFSTEVQFGEASGGHSITLRETSRIYTRTRRQRTLESTLAYTHTYTGMRACTYTRSGVVRLWSGPEARRQRASDVSLSRPHSVAMQLESVNRDPHSIRQKPRARLSWRQFVNRREEYPQTRGKTPKEEREREKGPAQTTEGKNEARKEDEENVGGTKTGAMVLDKNNAMRREKERWLKREDSEGNPQPVPRRRRQQQQ